MFYIAFFILLLLLLFIIIKITIKLAVNSTVKPAVNTTVKPTVKSTVNTKPLSKIITTKPIIKTTAKPATNIITTEPPTQIITTKPSTNITPTKSSFSNSEYTEKFLDKHRLPVFNETQFLVGLAAAVGPDILTSSMMKNLLKNIGKQFNELIVKKIYTKMSQSIAKKASQEMTKKLISKIGQEILHKLGRKMLSQAAAKAGAAAAKAGGKIAAKSAVLGSTGPVGWAAQAGMLVFDVVSLALDASDAGGYLKAGSKKMYIDMKKDIDKEDKKGIEDFHKQLVEKRKAELQLIINKLKATLSDSDKESYIKMKTELEYNINDLNKKTTYHPEIYGPFDNIPDIYDIINEKAKAELDRLADSKMVELSKDPIFIKLLKNEDWTGIDAFTGPKMKVYQESIDENKIRETIFSNECNKKNGKLVKDAHNDNQCSFKDKNTCETYTWPFKDDDGQEYVEYKDDIYGGACVKQSGLMRSVCDDNKLPYDSKTGICYIDEYYCKKKGMDWNWNFDIQQYDCMTNDGQKFAEMILGETVVKGLKQVFDPEQYEKCKNDEIDGANIANDKTFKDTIDIVMGISLVAGPFMQFAIIYFTLLNKLCFKKTTTCMEGEQLSTSKLMCYPHCMNKAYTDGHINKEQYTKWQKNKIPQNEIYRDNDITMCMRRYDGWDDMSKLDFNTNGQDSASLHKVTKNKPADCPDGWYKSSGEKGITCRQN